MNLAGKAGGCGYEQTNRIGNRADGVGVNPDADQRWRTNAAGPSRFHTITCRCCDNRRCDTGSRAHAFEYYHACGGRSGGRESRCDLERRDRPESCDCADKWGGASAITNAVAIDRPRAVPPPCGVDAPHDRHGADTRRGRNSDNRQRDHDARFRIDSGGALDDPGRATEPASTDGLPDARNQSRLLWPPTRLAGRPARGPYHVEGRERAHRNRHTGGGADRYRRYQPAFALDARRPIFTRGLCRSWERGIAPVLERYPNRERGPL